MSERIKWKWLPTTYGSDRWRIQIDMGGRVKVEVSRTFFVYMRNGILEKRWVFWFSRPQFDPANIGARTYVETWVDLRDVLTSMRGVALARKFADVE